MIAISVLVWGSSKDDALGMNGSWMVTGDKVRLTFYNLWDCFNCFSIEVKVDWVADWKHSSS